ncbi:MAG: ABC transporter ATP-binding protein [Candidatus Omnitrophota bacterium]|nr:ABC transporter ATP-binding protein [Candidatus Omnitrophota bacterium]
MDDLIQVKNISAGYGPRTVLKDVSFNINKGDFIGIIGPNGSGKSTLIRAISRVLKPFNGEILLNNRDIYCLDSRMVAKNIAVVLQETPVNFAFSVFEMVLMGRAPHLGRLELEGKKDFEIVRSCLSLTDTFHLAERDINELSGGERQRVIIAKALAQRPQILLLDEPVAHLDINHQIEISNLIKRLSIENDLTVMMVTHDLNLAADYCQRLILLKEGRIYAGGLPKEVITAQTIKDVYGAKCMVKTNPVTGAPLVIRNIYEGGN